MHSMNVCCSGDIVFLVEEKEADNDFICLHSFKNQEPISSPLIFNNVRPDLLSAVHDTAIIHACAS